MSVLIIVTITKFTHGAFLVFIAIPVLAVLMLGVERYYRDVDHEVAVDDSTWFGSSGDVAIVLVSKLQKPALKALDYAIAADHDRTIAVYVALSAEDGLQLQQEWRARSIPVPLVILDSPYRTFA